jgi:hypothetical protein
VDAGGDDAGGDLDAVVPVFDAGDRLPSLLGRQVLFLINDGPFSFC